MRFRVAISYARERLDFVEQVVAILARELGRKRVLFDKFLEAELARPNRERYLLTLYESESELIAPMICPSYLLTMWFRNEWKIIHERICKDRPDDVMLLRFGNVSLADMGLHPRDGYLDVHDKTPEEVATYILDRLQIKRVSETARSHALERLLQGCPPPYRRNIRAIHRALERTLDSWCRGSNRVVVITGAPGSGKNMGVDTALEVLLGGTREAPDDRPLWVEKDDICEIDLSTSMGSGSGCDPAEQLLDNLVRELFLRRGFPSPDLPGELSIAAKLDRVIGAESTGLLQIIHGHELLARSSVGENAFNTWLRSAANPHNKRGKCIVVLSQRRVERWETDGSPFNVGMVEHLNDEFELQDAQAHYGDGDGRVSATIEQVHRYVGGHPRAWELLGNAIGKEPARWTEWNEEARAEVLEVLSPYLSSLLRNACAVHGGATLLSRLCKHGGRSSLRRRDIAVAKDFVDIGIVRIDHDTNILRFKESVYRDFFHRELSVTSSWVHKVRDWFGARPRASTVS